MSALGRRSFAFVVLAFVHAGCGSTKEHEEVRPPGRVANTRGSAMVMSGDERVAIATNRSAGVVTIFHLDPQRPLEEIIVGQTEIDWDTREGRPRTDRGSEPWAAVIGADDDTAYVIARYDQTVTRIVDLHGEPRVDKSVAVGSEPTSIVISPRGIRLFVANWADGTISAIDTTDDLPVQTIDLNGALVDTDLLGPVDLRPALAHPRALAITDDGDEDDSEETLYATEFFSQPLDAGAATDDLDVSRQGLVYPIPLADQGLVSPPIRIAPVEDTGFVDSNGSRTGCYPNQLQAAAAVDGKLFVTSSCASPKGPLGPAANADGTPNPANFKTVVQPALFVIDTETGQELREEAVVLNAELEKRYMADTTVNGKMALIPNDLAVASAGDDVTACLTAMGADAVFCLRHAEGGLVDIGKAGNRFVDLQAVGVPGRLPIGMAMSKVSPLPFALVLSDTTQVVSVVDMTANSVATADFAVDRESRGGALRRTAEIVGRQLFATGLSVWSFKGQAWLSCESCHPDGLSDGVTWSFARGPRRTISTAGTFYGDGQQRLMLWTASIDEVHDVEGIARGVAGGVGGMVWTYPNDADPSNGARILFDGSAVPEGQSPPKPTTALHNNLNGSLSGLSAGQACRRDDAACDHGFLNDWDDIEAYIRSVRSPRAPEGFEPGQLSGGARLFDEGRCAGCHGGPGWTLSTRFYTPNDVNNGKLPYLKPSGLDAEMLGLLRTTPYTVPAEYVHLNPPAAEGPAFQRRWEPGDAAEVDYAYASTTAGDDQINCVLRDVGTFPEEGKEEAIVVAGVRPVRELRVNMTRALGATGFNVPSLVGLATGAPYFHAGNARTLEEAFDEVFVRHLQALAPEFLPVDDAARRDKIRALVAYLLSIDDDAVPPSFDAQQFDWCARTEP